ncbi:MAG: hypothetical protein ACFE0Q_21445 [Anaerolineae bacterium]
MRHQNFRIKNYYLEALLFAGIFTKMGNVLALGIYDLTHQLRVTPTLFHEFDFWDDVAFVMIEDIIANSPISNVDAIYFQYDDVACVVVPIRTGTYLIMLCKGNQEILIHQFEKWRKQILHFVQQLDDEET